MSTVRCHALQLLSSSRIRWLVCDGSILRLRLSQSFVTALPAPRAKPRAASENAKPLTEPLAPLAPLCGLLLRRVASWGWWYLCWRRPEPIPDRPRWPEENSTKHATDALADPACHPLRRRCQGLPLPIPLSLFPQRLDSSWMLDCETITTQISSSRCNCGVA